MTLLLPAADRVVREAVDAVLDGRTRPGAGADISFATRSSRYRLIHGVLREATDSSLVGARFIGWLFDGTREPKVSERWDTDARAVLLDESKGQIIVSSLTRVHVENALPPEALDLPSTQLDGGFPQRAGTLHGLAAVDPLPEPSTSPQPAAGSSAVGAPGAEPAAGARSNIVPSSPPPAPAPAGRPQPAPPQGHAVAAPGPAATVSSPPNPSMPQQGSPVPKRTIPPAPPIPGRQATPVPPGAPGPARPPTPAHPGTRTTPMAAVAPPPPPTVPQIAAPPPPPTVPQAVPSPAGPPGPPPRMGTPRTYFGLGPATNPPPPMAAPPAAKASGPAIPSDAPLPQFDLDDMDIPTRTDPLPPAPPSEEGEVAIPLIPRSDG